MRRPSSRINEAALEEAQAKLAHEHEERLKVIKSVLKPIELYYLQLGHFATKLYLMNSRSIYGVASQVIGEEQVKKAEAEVKIALALAAGGLAYEGVECSKKVVEADPDIGSPGNRGESQ